jgi:hypothetical protein
MKAFSVFINELNEGSTHAAITADLAELLQTVQNTGKGGELTLKIKVQPAVKGNAGYVDRIVIAVDRALKLPKNEQPSDFFYLSEEGEPVRNHPRQQTLELRDTASQPPVTFKTA